MIVKLSYNLSENMPFYEGIPQPKIEPFADFSKGNQWRSLYFTTNNHFGTHVDAPNHFCPTGRKICEYKIEDLIFERVAILPISIGETELINPEHLSGLRGVRQDCDLLLIKTGFSRFRESAPRTYADRSPGFSRRSAEYVMDALPTLRALMVDFISMAAAAHMEDGCDAHRVFLGYPGPGKRSILLIEDSFIPDALPVPKKVYAVPLFFEGLDSAPCTVFADV
ncbi:MAG: cyclase family protein [Terriglobia bacterium]